MIDSYAFGRIVIDGVQYRSDVIIYPDRVEANWWRENGHRVTLQDLAGVLSYGPRVLVIGQGKFGRMHADEAVKVEAGRRGIELFAAPTEAAVAEYNRRSSQANVVAALHLTC